MTESMKEVSEYQQAMMFWGYSEEIKQRHAAWDDAQLKRKALEAAITDALSKTRAEGRREGIEDAAKLHEEDAERLEDFASGIARVHGAEDSEVMADASRLRMYARKIRALATPAGKER